MMGLHVVVVEDDHDVGHFLMYQLEGKVLKTVLITAPEEALDESVWQYGDDIQVAGVIDLMMPKVDGIEVAKWVRERFPDIHLVAVTAIDEYSDIWKEAEGIFDVVLRKEVGAFPLIDVLRDFVS